MHLTDETIAFCVTVTVAFVCGVVCVECVECVMKCKYEGEGGEDIDVRTCG